jgi:antitoxin component of MazEF toxin-antitoxin module
LPHLPAPDAARCRVKLSSNGTSTCVNIPRAVLFYLGWLCGEEVVLELLEDQSIRLRRLTRDDFPVPRQLRVVPIGPARESK